MVSKNKFLVNFILGTRPEAIKLAPVINRFQNNHNFDVKVILSGQHDEMILQVMETFKIKADMNLKILKKCQSLSDISAEILKDLGKLFSSHPPNIIFVQGDTSTALAGALAAFFNRIPVAHIEAGLRTEDLFSPFPEEANRRLISQISSLHFSPTKLALNNLIQSGIQKNTFLTGNTVVDALELAEKAEFNNAIIKDFNIYEEKYILTTVHRRENWGKAIEKISSSILQILNQNDDLKLVFPLHKNPLVRNPFQKLLGSHKNIFLIEPVAYLDFINLLKNSTIVLTDSGGIQEEAATLGKPTVVLRDSTERPEVILRGNACLVGTDPLKIKETINSLLADKKKFQLMSNRINDFGDGKASEIICMKTFEFLKNNA